MRAKKKKKSQKKNLFSTHVKQQKRPHDEQRPARPPRALARGPVPLLPRPRRELRRDPLGLCQSAPLRRHAAPGDDALGRRRRRQSAASAATSAAAFPVPAKKPPVPPPEQRRRRHPGLHPQQVAHRHVEHPRIPPALVEVGQRVRERELAELEADAEGPQQPAVAHEHGLCPPA